MTPQAIAADYHLSLAEIHAALTYYYDHQAEIDAQAAADDARLAAAADADRSPLAEKTRTSFAPCTRFVNVTSQKPGR